MSNRENVLGWIRSELETPIHYEITDGGRSFRGYVDGKARRLDITDEVLERWSFQEILDTLRAAEVATHLRTDCTWAYLTQAGLTWLCGHHAHAS